MKTKFLAEDQVGNRYEIIKHQTQLTVHQDTSPNQTIIKGVETYTHRNKPVHPMEEDDLYYIVDLDTEVKKI